MWQQRLFGGGRGRVFLTRALDPIIECRGIEMEEFCYGGWRVCGSMDRMGKQKTLAELLTNTKLIPLPLIPLL